MAASISDCGLPLPGAVPTHRTTLNPDSPQGWAVSLSPSPGEAEDLAHPSTPHNRCSFCHPLPSSTPNPGHTLAIVPQNHDPEISLDRALSSPSNQSSRVLLGRAP